MLSNCLLNMCMPIDLDYSQPWWEKLVFAVIISLVEGCRTAQSAEDKSVRAQSGMLSSEHVRASTMWPPRTVVACTRLRTRSSQPNPGLYGIEDLQASHHTEALLVVDSCWKRKNHFVWVWVKDVASGTFSMLQFMGPHSSKYGQNQLNLMSYQKKKEKTWNYGWLWQGELRRGWRREIRIDNDWSYFHSIHIWNYQK